MHILFPVEQMITLTAIQVYNVASSSTQRYASIPKFLP